MKTKIVIGSLLAVFILLMIPSVPAVEYNTIVEANKAQFLERIQNIDIDKINKKLRDSLLSVLHEHNTYNIINIIRFILCVLAFLFGCFLGHILYTFIIGPILDKIL